MARKFIAGRKVGSLEEAIMGLLWKAEHPLTGREIHEALPGPPRAYTTVMTVLGRLEDKGLVERISEDRGFRYRAAGDQEELTARAMGELLSSVKDPVSVFAHFLAGVDDPSLLEELASLLERTQATSRHAGNKQAGSPDEKREGRA